MSRKTLLSSLLVALLLLPAPAPCTSPACAAAEPPAPSKQTQGIELEPLGESTAPPAQQSDESNLIYLLPYEGREGELRDRLLREGGGTAESEASLAAALSWLAEQQNDDGSWNFHRDTLDAPLGATGLALLVFLADGQTHLQGEHKDNVKNGLEYLLQSMRVAGNRGDLSGDDGGLISHGICTQALCDAYAMTIDDGLERPAQIAINHSVYAQDPTGGGWGAAPQEAGNTPNTARQILALHSAHMAYLETPPQTIVDASNFFDSVQQNEGAIYGYDEAGDDPTATAAALLCRIHLGWRREHPALQRGVASLAEAGPSETDMLFNLYANQVLFHYGGEHWEAWNRELRDWLLEAQSTEGDTAGSWQFERDESEHADPAAGDRLHDTCLAALILQVYYRQLPLYTETDD